jgi:diguanylate cyclase (GGDEF)-like protein
MVRAFAAQAEGNMQVSRLKMVAEECTRDLADEGAVHVTAYYFHKEKWWNAEDSSEADSALRVELSKCLNDGNPHRAPKSTSSNFPLQDVKAVIRAKFLVALRKQRHDAIQRIVQRSVRNASNAFDVKYNSKTGLLSKSAFNELVIERLEFIRALGTSTNKSDESIPHALCLLAIDIDHFKQVNDSHGHSYGDLVIRSFGIRIDKAVKAFISQSARKIQGTCAHVSGEEFFCVVWGAAPTAEFEELAESVLAAVRDEPLPSDEELELLKSTYSQEQLVIPKAGNRLIECSIGGVVTGAPTSQDTKNVMEKLINQADLALYKSKNQGRNRAIFFATILQRGGRVLEHKPDVAICIIDIGEEVGVIKGQEFIVLHPEFTGSTPYVFDDGRSRKILGTMPKSALCTITAFDVQRQISFCRISEERFMKLSVPRNSALEAIPLGTLSVPVLGPLVPMPADILLETVASIADTQHAIEGDVAATEQRSFAVIGIRNEKESLSNFGPASVNRGLAAACRNLQRLKDTPFLGQLEPTRLLLQYRTFSPVQSAELDSALAQAEGDTGGRVKFVGGVFAPAYDQKTKQLPGVTTLRTRVDLARYAASSEATHPGKRVEVFSLSTAERILERLRQLREFQRGLADYQRFTQIGLQSADLDNYAGLMASAMREFAVAEGLYLRAADQAPPTEVVYRLNAVTMQVALENLEAAAQTVDKIDQSSLEEHYKYFGYGTGCLALALSNRALKSMTIQDSSHAQLWLMRALELKPSEYMKVRLQANLDKINALVGAPD